jgi:RHS repeat-associated protein
MRNRTVPGAWWCPLTRISPSSYRARYYDAAGGRFLSEDPIGFFGGINRYAYVHNDSPNWVDNYGTCDCPDPKAINDQISDLEDEMVNNLSLPLKGALKGGVGGFILGCFASLEVGCVEGGVPAAAVGALGGLLEGSAEDIYRNTKIVLKIRKLKHSLCQW